MYKHTSSSNRFRCTQCPYNCKNYSKLKVGNCFWDFFKFLKKFLFLKF